MTTQNQLETAMKLREAGRAINYCPSHPLKTEEKALKEIQAILSHFASISRTEGAIEGFKKAKAQWDNPDMDEYDVWLDEQVANLERKLSALSATPSISKPAGLKMAVIKDEKV